MSIPPQQPPFDPRMWREQQRAARRAQRDAWRAQRQAWKAQYGYPPQARSVVGPLLLVGIGVVALLIMSGRLDAGLFWQWYGHWWPLLLIGAGLAMLGEWALDARREVPVRRGGSFVGVLVLLAVLGMVMAAVHGNWNFHPNMEDQSDFFNSFGKPQHDRDQQVLNAVVPANASIQVENPRGDVSITAGDDANVQVQAHQIAYAGSDSEAQRIFAAETAHVTVSGGTVLVKADGHDAGRVNLTIVVPKSATVQVQAGRGDVSVTGVAANAAVTAAHGDVHLSEIGGSAQVHFSNDKGDFSAHQVGGDITADGRCNDLTLSEVKGKVTVNGDIFGDAHFENLGGPVHLHTSVTDLQLGELTGDLTLDDDSLRVTGAKGSTRVTTHSKDVDLGEIAGDVFVEDRDGDISVAPAGNFTVEARNSSGHGDVSLTLPGNASATVDARTRNGDIVSDFPMSSPGDEDSKTARLVVGAGQARMALSTDVGDVRIKRGSNVSAAPEPPKLPKAPIPPSAPHLRAPKAPVEPVMQ